MLVSLPLLAVSPSWLLSLALSIYVLLLLEPLANTFTVLQELFRTLGDTTGFFGSQVGGGEVVDTVFETSGH